jgi:large subunit ribosomal protein L17
MRKIVFGRKLSRSRKSRIALFRSLIKALITNGKITTTKAKAKAIQGQADKIITLAKKSDLSARRRALAFLGNDRKVTDFLFTKLAPVFKERQSGFTRITLLPRRKGDNAEMAILEWVEKYVEEVKKEKVGKKETGNKKEGKKIKKEKKAESKNTKKVKK